ncbi:FAD-dependent monooxygenase [Streptomyces sp. B-S-A8]|uniref:FAD-dependent monooxygenase n=1 Tax=Streptomyces solicavernae TaxID=3043614 RepID=A0ABT6RP80_9ACTN|nr:FAD-dependent monooxygenase [Streptomyces sp. B-S-A8]MDI3386218.1 FAD-dependent monooxygenase [Streptomyces sp. B-S-A8]
MKALICGAGIAGLALAERLSAYGWEVLLVERAAGPRPEGYMMDFFGPGFEAVTAMGLEPRLRELAQETDEFTYVDPAGKPLAAVSYARFERAAGSRLVSIMRPALEQLLREAVTGRPGVQVRFGATVDAAEDLPDGRVRAGLSDGTAAEVDLLVGADGVHSRVRALRFGPERDHLLHLGLHTAAFTFTDPELFALVRNRFALTDTLDRQLGLYGLRDRTDGEPSAGGRVAAFTVHRAGTELPADPRAVLLSAFTGAGPVADRTFARLPDGAGLYYDQVAQIRAPRWSAGSTVLLGDAAHAVSLIAGQGASLGIAGAYLLAERLRTATGPESIRAGLAAYESRWRPVVTSVQDSARNRVTGLFLPRTPGQLRLRRWGFRAMNLPGMDRVLARSFLPKDHTPVTRLAA